MSTREIARVALSDRVPLTTPFAPLTVVVQNPEGTSIRFDFDYLDPRFQVLVFEGVEVLRRDVAPLATVNGTNTRALPSLSTTSRTCPL